VEFIDENGGGPGVRLRKREQIIANAGFRDDVYGRSNGSCERNGVAGREVNLALPHQCGL
jgi:hypothetical protein